MGGGLTVGKAHGVEACQMYWGVSRCLSDIRLLVHGWVHGVHVELNAFGVLGRQFPFPKWPGTSGVIMGFNVPG